MSASEKLTFKENGGPAFPSSYNSFASGGSGGGGGYSNQGMSLRDYFAAKAMDALIAGYLASKSKEDSFDTSKGDHSHAAEVAYKIADAMLEARK